MVPKKVSKEVEYRYNKLLDVIGGADDEVLEMMFTFHSTLLGQDILKNCDNEDWTANISEKSSDYVLILGEDCIKHPNYKNIAHLAGIVEKYTPFKVIIPPTQTNTLGVSLICDLDSEVSGKTVGYNVQADYQISALGDGNLDMPVLNQQEGTFVNIDKRVVPTNAALSYNGYELNDIANEILDTKVEYTIDYTEKLFNNIKFDDLKNEFKNNWQEHRGYILDNDIVDTENIDVLCENKALEVDENSFIIYNGNPINQFNEFTAKASQFKDDIVALYLSDELSKKLDVSNENKVKVTKDNNSVILDVRVDNSLIGDISYVPTFDKNCETKKLFDDTRFSIVNIEKV
jgi:NADH-quinone oxidoreductase subunit G